MKKLLLLAAVFSTLSSSILTAQDPGFRAIKPASAGAPPTAASPTGDMGSASLINNMDQLDGSRPLSIGDLVSIRIVEENREAISKTVQDSGDIQAPHVGLVKAVGKTPKELAYAIKQALELSVFKKATVIVALDKAVVLQGRNTPGGAAPEHFTIFGHVIQQGKYEMPPSEDITISQAILRANGFSQFANKKAVKIVRKTPQGNKTIKVNVEDIMINGNLTIDIFIRDGDVIIVRENQVTM